MNRNPQKILFICSSLEPGKDGVGDYTRKLACGLIAKGYNAAIIAINDRRLEEKIWQGKQIEDNREVDVLRLSVSDTWNNRLRVSKKFLNEFYPDWLSLQYVPFGFNIKGLPFNLGKKLKRLNKNAGWHVMFHELAVNKEESYKFKIWALLQEKIIRSILLNLKPAIIHTNTELYKYRIKDLGFEAKVLPLFSNISKAKMHENETYKSIIPAFIQQHRGDYIIGTLFGSFDFKRWDMHSLLKKFTYKFSSNRIAIASLGRMPSGHFYWDSLKKKYPQVDFIDLGEQSAGFISYWLYEFTDFGILTTLPELSGKSGSFMAFKEHGIPVVCTQQTLSLQDFKISLDPVLTCIDPGKEFVLPIKYTPVPMLNSVVNQFTSDLTGNSQIIHHP